MSHRYLESPIKQHCAHNVSSLLDVSTLLEPRQEKLWGSMTSIKLKIRSDHVLETSVVRYVVQLVQKINALEGLKHFHLSIRGQRGRFGAAALATVLQASRKLVSLDIGNGFIYGNMCPLSEAFRCHSHLESVILLDCHAFDEGSDLLALIQVLSENPKIKYLTLDSALLQSTDGNVAGVLSAFGRSKTLLSLKLQNRPDHGIEEEDLLPLLKEVKANETMKEFSIYDTSPAASRFGSSLSTALGLMICFNTTMETLLLTLQPESVSPVINGLRFNKTLKKLHLHSHQPCLESIMGTLEEVLRDDNYILEHCQLGIRPSPEIDYYLTLNQLGRHFLLTSEVATEQDWINTISHQDQADVVLYFMMKNPSLFCQQQPVTKKAKRQEEWTEADTVRKQPSKRVKC
jgi:hypothetical protein